MRSTAVFTPPDAQADVGAGQPHCPFAHAVIGAGDIAAAVGSRDRAVQVTAVTAAKRP